jgi:hypothetical protein
MHFVFPAAPPSGFTIEEMVEEAAEPGPLRLTSWEVEEVHILTDRSGVSLGVQRGKDRRGHTGGIVCELI